MSELIQQNEYHPDSVSPPGETIGETLVLRNMTRRAFADAMHYGEATIYRLLNGQKQITPAVALQLEKVLDVPAEFWLNREAAYSASIGRRVFNPTVAQNLLSTTKRKGNALNIYLAGGMRTAQAAFADLAPIFEKAADQIGAAFPPLIDAYFDPKGPYAAMRQEWKDQIREVENDILAELREGMPLGDLKFTSSYPGYEKDQPEE